MPIELISYISFFFSNYTHTFHKRCAEIEMKTWSFKGLFIIYCKTQRTNILAKRFDSFFLIACDCNIFHSGKSIVDDTCLV